MTDTDYTTAQWQPAATFVMVHGSGFGGWLWQRVRRMLQARGYEVYTPTLTGMGERAHLANPSINLTTHIDDVLGVLEYEDLHDVILVGHSYSGMVVTGVAERAPERLAQLVYVDAFVPRDGEAEWDLLPPVMRGWWETRAQEQGDGWRFRLPTPVLGRIEEGGPTREELLELLQRASPQPLACYKEAVRLGNPAAAKLPRSYIYCSDKPADVPLRHYAPRIVDEPGWRQYELVTGHLPMLTMPHELTRLLVDIAS